MAFEGISAKLQSVFKKLTGRGRLSEKDVRDAMREYQLIGEEGPDHMKTFRMAVLLHGEELGRGEGTSKQNAGQAAAREALRKMGETV